MIVSHRPRQRGAILVVVLAVLALIAIIAVTFAALMRLERKATTNFRNLRKTELIANSAEASVVAMLRGGLFWDAFVHWNKEAAPWIYGVRADSPQLGNRVSLESAVPGETSYSWILPNTYPQGYDYFKTKVIDTSSQININSGQDTLAEMLDHLGEALRKDTNWGVNPFFSQPREAGNRITGHKIMEFRAKLEGNEFASKTQMRQFIGEENFAILADFITTHSWTDRTTYRATDGKEQHRVFGTDQPATAVPKAGEGPQIEIVGVARVSAEHRAPININTAAEPVLIACLQGLACRRPYPFTTLERQRVEEANRGAIDLGDGGTLPTTEEELRARLEPVWVYSQPLRYEDAQRIAREIIARRKETPFRMWQAGDTDTKTSKSPGFEEFVNALEESAFPPPHTIKAVNPRDPNPRTGRYTSELVSGDTDTARAFKKGYGAGAQGRRDQGLPWANSYAWYYEMIRSMLLANFNPNTRINKYNPNATAYQAVDKSNLVSLDVQGEAAPVPRPAHTTEFCFDSGGFYEISTIAQITGQESTGSEPAKAEEDFRMQDRFALVKQRSIVKVFEVLRHTTQADFERPFNALSLSSAKDRRHVTTFPDPIQLLHPSLYHGSRQDGYVELAGKRDALLGEAAPAERSAQYGGQGGNVQLAYGARFRSDSSASKLAQLSRTNRASEGYQIELRRALDPDYAREGKNFTKRYSNDYWESTSEADEQFAVVREPIVDEIQKGGDVYPDGLNSSQFRTSTLGTRFLQLPASYYRSGPSDQGAAKSKSNVVGNLPYYHGGVSFWVKLEFDGDDPVFGGFVGATQVQQEVGQTPEDSEGTQFYIWKNTVGELRVSRIYYHQAFLRDDGTPVPVVDEEDPDSSGIHVDEKKIFARSDVGVDIRHWKAHDWHHVAIAYNDGVELDPVKVFVDFQSEKGFAVDMGKGQFCTLNVEEPKDGIFVGGFVRDQAAASEGLFKFNTNLSDSNQEVGESFKRVAANATIDEFTCFAQDFSGTGSEGYFTEKEGIYSNLFRIPLAEGIQRVRLRSFTWTAYRPRTYHGAITKPHPRGGVRAALYGVGRSGREEVSDAGGDARLNASVAGQWLYLKGNLGERVAEVVYQFRLRAATGGDQTYGSRAVASPVIDDVRLTYYLPSAQVVLGESD